MNSLKSTQKRKLEVGHLGLSTLVIYINLSGINTKLNQEIAVKLVYYLMKKEPMRASHPQVFSESKLYSMLQGGGKNILNILRGYP